MMTELELNQMDIKDLQALKKAVDKAVVGYEERRRAATIAKLREAAKNEGFELSELMGFNEPKKRSPAVPKYKHPENSEITWSGRGRQPDWFKTAIESGTAAEDLLIA